MKKDVVYIFRKWPLDSLELRLSLRSLKNIEYRDVYVIWDKPKWLQNVIHIPYIDQSNDKSLNALNKIKEICKTEWVSEDFILMNDDFYALRKTKVEYRHQWTIKKHIDRIVQQWQSGSKYFIGLLQTAWLFPDGLDYSLHRPMIYNKELFLKMVDKYNFSHWMLIRNIYWNEYNVGWKEVWDLKIEKYRDIGNEEWLSSWDDCILDPNFIEFMLGIFPYQSIYEFYNINENNMLAKANYNITIDWVIYNKGVTYQINPWVQGKHPMTWKDYFDIIEQKEVKKVVEQPKKEVKAVEKQEEVSSDIVQEELEEDKIDGVVDTSIDTENIDVLVGLLRDNWIFAQKGWKLATLQKKCKEAGLI